MSRMYIGSDGYFPDEAFVRAGAALSYVPHPTGDYTTDTANIAAAAARLPTAGPPFGGTVILREGLYNASLPDLPWVTFQGQGGTATEVRCSTGVMLTTAALREGVAFEHLTLSTTAGHIIDLGSTGGLANGYFEDVRMVSYIDAASLITGTGTCSLQSMTFRDVRLHRNATATVPGIDVRSSAGAINSNIFDTVTCYALDGTTGGPFIRLEGTLAAYCHDNTFRNLIGQGCRSGLVHVYSPNGLVLESVTGWDATGNYTDHLTAVFTSATTGGKLPRGVEVSNVGTRYGTMDSGKYHFSAPAVPGSAISISNVGDPNGVSASLPYFTGQSVRDASGASGAFQTSATSYTLDYVIDGTVLFDGSSITATLPAPGSSPYAGRTFTIINKNATSLTISGAVGVSSLAQNTAQIFVTDGAAWYPAS